jgi:anti-sigma B factor antagonist
MFEITRGDDGTVRLRGRLDAAQVELHAAEFERIASSCVLDFSELEYISSAGLGLLFATLRRLTDAGGGLTIVNLRPYIRELFGIAGFDRIFAID